MVIFLVYAAFISMMFGVSLGVSVALIRNVPPGPMWVLAGVIGAATMLIVFLVLASLKVTP